MSWVWEDNLAERWEPRTKRRVMEEAAVEQPKTDGATLLDSVPPAYARKLARIVELLAPYPEIRLAVSNALLEDERRAREPGWKNDSRITH
jgi:hypothetical protein